MPQNAIIKGGGYKANVPFTIGLDSDLSLPLGSQTILAFTKAAATPAYSDPYDVWDGPGAPSIYTFRALFTGTMQFTVSLNITAPSGNISVTSDLFDYLSGAVGHIMHLQTYTGGLTETHSATASLSVTAGRDYYIGAGYTGAASGGTVNHNNAGSYITGIYV